MAEEQLFPGYPKAKYRRAAEGEGDIVQQYSQDRHPYVSRLVKSPKEEESIGPGWFDHPREMELAQKQAVEVVLPESKAAKVKISAVSTRDES